MPVRSKLTLIVAAWLAYVALGVGFVSSNDGSHVALARALGVRHETIIDPEVGLTLQVDRARRGVHDYSDRPPGTAFAAVPAMWIGHALDSPLARRSESTRELVVQPGSAPYIQTYASRSSGGPPLYRLQGTALASQIQAALMGALGLWVLASLAVTYGVGAAGLAMVATMGACTLWGPYSTMLFSHVTAGTFLTGLVLWARRDIARPAAVSAALAGFCGAWAVAADYALVIAVVPLVLLHVPRGRWGWVLLGAAPVVLATAAYHHVAFGSPFSIGYDHSTNFAFARSRSATFSGNPGVGFWTLWGAGRGAGVLVLSPILLPGAVGLWRLDRRLALGLVPWLVLLCFHRTPWGGAGEDHRYLIPAIPFLMLGVGRLWIDTAKRPRWRAAGAAMALLSAALTWGHFLAWRTQA